jgi:hypothetical protein
MRKGEPVTITTATNEMNELYELNKIQQDLDSWVEINEQEDDVVIVSFKMNPDTVKHVFAFCILFIEFLKTYFFPERVFRKPRLREVWRNFKIVLGVLRLKNLIQDIFRGNKQSAESRFEQEYEELSKLKKVNDEQDRDTEGFP